MTNDALHRLWQSATIMGAFVTAASVIFGVITYRRGVHEQRQAAAVGMVQQYLELSLEHPDLASRSPGQPVDARYNWFATHATFTAETLWSLVGDDPKWQGTIEFLLRQHQGYLQQGVMACAAFQPEFIEFARERFPELECGDH